MGADQLDPPHNPWVGQGILQVKEEDYHYLDIHYLIEDFQEDFQEDPPEEVEVEV